MKTFPDADIQDQHADPTLLVAIGRAHLLLTINIGLIVRKEQELNTIESCLMTHVSPSLSG
jgi:hypothetical protein